MARFAERFGRYGFSYEAFFPCYGLAEATLMATAPAKDEAPLVRRFDGEALLAHRAVPSEDGSNPALVGCGRPSERHRVEIVDPAARTRTAADEVGEIWISGPSVANGYWGKRADPTFEARLADSDSPDRFLRTGDLGLFHEGQLFVIGRLSDLIILRGRNHHPHDIEELAELEPLLIPHSSAAFELRDSAGEAAVALVAESRCGEEEELEGAIARARERVCDELEVPLALVAICERGAVPKTTSGKIQRRLCRSLLEAGELEVFAEWRSPVLLEESAGTA
jgi:acyl-CoA synthetase (AMP-forming)/AMP-acid ligase II